MWPHNWHLHNLHYIIIILAIFNNKDIGTIQIEYLQYHKQVTQITDRETSNM